MRKKFFESRQSFHNRVIQDQSFNKEDLLEYYETVSSKALSKSELNDVEFWIEKLDRLERKDFNYVERLYFSFERFKEWRDRMVILYWNFKLKNSSFFKLVDKYSPISIFERLLGFFKKAYDDYCLSCYLYRMDK